MDDHTRLSINKSTASILFRHDPEFDITAVRIGKTRVARRKENKLSEIKQAILLKRESVSKAPTISSEGGAAENSHDSPPKSPKASSNPYMDYQPSEVLDELTFRVLKELARLQEKGKQQPQEKRYKYKRFVAGIREVHRALVRGELKGIIVAANLESDVDALNDMVLNLKNEADQREVPFVIALNKRRVGKALNKSMKQSVVGITNLDGVHPDWRSILAEVDRLRIQVPNSESTPDR